MYRVWSGVVSATLVLGAAVSGCSESSSRYQPVAVPPSGATAPGSQTGPGTTPPGPPAPASQGNPVDAFNAEIQELWDALLPALLPQLQAMAQQQLGGTHYTSSAVDVDVVNVNAVPASIAVAPGFLHLDERRAHLWIPRQGTWSIALEATVRVRVNAGSFSPSIDLPLRVEVNDLTAEVEVEFDHSDPTRPVVRRVGQPQVAFSVRLDSSNPLVGQLTGVLSPVADWLAQRLVTTGLQSLLPSLTQMQGLPGPVPAAGAPPLTDSGRATPFADIVDGVEVKLRRDHVPHGTILNADMDQPMLGSWLDDYQSGGAGNVGNVVGRNDGGDSAIWTGTYLAGEALRYAVTADPAAEDDVRHAVWGIGNLLDVNGGTGLLARVVGPVNSHVGQQIQNGGAFRSATINGQTWVSDQGSKGISRDQYSGVMFGLSLAYEHVPSVRPDAARRIETILDYLIARDWVITEDRPLWNGSNGSRGPTSWAGIHYQKLAFLHIGHRVNPAKYGPHLAAAGPLSKVAWLGLWTNTFGLDHYYKYNLSHIGLYNFFRLESDPVRWQDLARGYRVLERYVGHHHNAHFDLIQTSIDPSTSAVLFPSAVEALRQLVRAPHREVAPAVIDLSSVTWITVNEVAYDWGNGSLQILQTTRTMPSEPLEVHLRRPEGNFWWQRDPFTPAIPSQGSPYREKPGIELTLPYWMARHQGAL